MTKRRTWHTIATITLAVFAMLTAALWLASGIIIFDRMTLLEGTRVRYTDCSRGTFESSTMDLTARRSAVINALNKSSPIKWRYQAWWPRFDWEFKLDFPNPRNGNHFGFSIPFWWLPLLLGALPVWRLSSYLLTRRQKRYEQGLCVTCGYDLRASAIRCPECGQEIVAANLILNDRLVASVNWLIDRRNLPIIIRAAALALTLFELFFSVVALLAFLFHASPRGISEDFRIYLLTLAASTYLSLILTASLRRHRASLGQSIFNSV